MWQQETFERINTALVTREGVKEVILLGSVASDEGPDQWSDLDIGVLVTPELFGDFFPTTGWIEQFGAICAFNQSSGRSKATTRVVFSDGRRVDFSIASHKNLFAADTSAPATHEQLDVLAGIANDFKFDAFLAVSKIAREDFLIGLHLLLELERKCLVLAMMLRDRDAKTTHHRRGGAYNEVIDNLKAFDSTKQGLLDRISAAIQLFNTLSGDLSLSSHDWTPLRNYIQRARGERPVL